MTDSDQSLPGKHAQGAVAFQGERGAYSEAAVHAFFAPDIPVKPFRTLSEVFSSVEEASVKSAVVPIENSLEGAVNETYDLLLTTGVRVCGEVNLRIVHCLISRPETSFKEVKVVYSHPQALAQCRRFIETYRLEPKPVYDTAGSVIMLKKTDKSAAAIASLHAAKIYGMKVLKRGIEDSHSNYTRFFVLGMKDSPRGGADKTSIIFSAKHVPGSLYRILGEFASRKINLTKIESRPTRKTPWEYVFYVDFEGHRTDRLCEEALREVRTRALFLKVIGSYPKAGPI